MVDPAEETARLPAAGRDGPAQPTPPGPGTLIANRYRLRDTVGQGGMGVVWRAHDETLDRTVAVKQLVLSPNLRHEEREVLRERVMREARAAARLHDPAAVTVYDVVTDGDSPYLVMELVDATSLSELIRSDGPRPIPEVARIGIAVLGALDAAHQAGIVHRDVKPGNVMICANGRVLLADFGIASTQGDPSITQTGLLLGSPSYISPERAQGQVGGPESDLWALGATLYTAVEGLPAYDADDALATLTAIVDGRRREPRYAGPLAPVISALMAKDAAARPSAAEARRMLVDVLDGDGPAAAPLADPATRTTLLPPVPDSPAQHTQVIEPLAAVPSSVPAGLTVPDEIRVRPRRRRRTGLVVALSLLTVLILAGATIGALFATGRLGGSSSSALGDGAVPQGWVLDDESSFRLYHPADWKRISVPGGGSAYGQSPTLYARVLIYGNGSPMALLSKLDKDKAAEQAGYTKIGLTSTSPDRADLEWTELEGATRYHLLERALLVGNRVYTLLFFVDDARWGTALRTFNAISGTFKPTG